MIARLLPRARRHLHADRTLAVLPHRGPLHQPRRARRTRPVRMPAAPAASGGLAERSDPTGPASLHATSLVTGFPRAHSRTRRAQVDEENRVGCDCRHGSRGRRSRRDTWGLAASAPPPVTDFPPWYATENARGDPQPRTSRRMCRARSTLYPTPRASSEAGARALPRRGDGRSRRPTSCRSCG